LEGGVLVALQALGRCWWSIIKEKRKWGREAAPHPPKQWRRKREEIKRGGEKPEVRPLAPHNNTLSTK